MKQTCKILTIACAAAICLSAQAAKVNSERTITVGDLTRKYVLYVPDNVQADAPLVFSLHGAAGHDTDRAPFRTSVADQKGCIVVYPQGVDQFFPVFGGYIPGWNSTGEANEDLDFLKAVIEKVASEYSIDRSRIYCCGFSNGGMMTYSNSSSAADIFAAFASISGFQLNEFHHRHTGARPVPFLHIHGKADDFVKYSCMPIIRDNMVARNGCNPVPQVTTKAGKYTKSVYEAGDGGFPYVYYEIDGMGHNDYTGNTEDGNSALTMWNFMSQYRLDDPCDPTLKWRLNLDTEGFNPKEHSWKVTENGARYEYGIPKKPNNIDNNVYPSMQFEAGDYTLQLRASGDAGDKVYVVFEPLDGGSPMMSMSAPANVDAEMPFGTDAYGEYKVTILKSNPDMRFERLEIHSLAAPGTAVNATDDTLPEAVVEPEGGYLIEIPQDQGRQYDDFSRTSFTPGEDYNTYVANSDLQIAFKMMNIDVTDCDYVVVKFAEPVAAGWHLAFWSGTDLVDVPGGTTEYKFELEQSMINSGIMPQICLMTFFGGYTAPLTAKVKGVYKHSTLDAPDGLTSIKTDTSAPSYISLSGIVSPTPHPGLNIIVNPDGTTEKIIYK